MSRPPLPPAQAKAAQVVGFLIGTLISVAVVVVLMGVLLLLGTWVAGLLR